MAAPRIAGGAKPRCRQRSGQKQSRDLPEGLAKQAISERELEHVAVHANVLECGTLRQDMGTFQSSKRSRRITLSFGLCRGGQFYLYVWSDLIGKR